jgi:hypothetical protein
MLLIIGLLIQCQFIFASEDYNFTWGPTNYPTVHHKPSPSSFGGIFTMIVTFLAVLFVGVFSAGLFIYLDPELKQQFMRYWRLNSTSDYQQLSTPDIAIEEDLHGTNSQNNLSDTDFSDKFNLSTDDSTEDS